MRYLLDEMLCDQTANAIQALALNDDEFQYIAGSEVNRAGAQDEDIPGICSEGGWQTLITANVRDFGARKVLWQTLLAKGVNVVVLRPGKRTLDPLYQVSLFTRHYQRVNRHIADANKPTLLRVTDQGVHERSLDELITEFGAGDQPRTLP